MKLTSEINDLGLLEELEKAAALIEHVRKVQSETPISLRGRPVLGLKDAANRAFAGVSILPKMRSDMPRIKDKAYKAFCAFETLRQRHSVNDTGVKSHMVAGLLAAEIWADRLQKVAAHAERMKQLHAYPAFAAANAERMKQLHADPEFATAHAERGRERMKQLHADPEFATAHAERGRERMKKLNVDPEFAAALAERSRERMKKLHADPEFAAANAERMKKLHDDPEFEAKRISGIRAAAARRRAAKAGGTQSPDALPDDLTP